MIDTEGNDHIILADVLKKIDAGMVIESIKFEYQVEFNNTLDLNHLIDEYEDRGYINRQCDQTNMLLTRTTI